MSDTLTVPTAFNDISQLAEGMADRVDEERLMLYGPDPVEDNSWVRFSVLLMDQSSALEGIGRAVASIDGGEERPEVARFDIVLDNLQFEGTSEVVYERMLLVRSQAFSEGPGTGEVSLDDVQHVEEEIAATGFEDEATQVAVEGEYSAHVEASSSDHEQATAVAPALDSSEGYGDAGYAEEVDAEEVVSVAPEPAPVSSWEDSGATEAEQEDYADVGTGEIALPDELDEGWGADAAIEYTDDVQIASVPPSAPPPAPPSAPPPVLINPLISGSSGPLLRASRGAVWTPRLEPAPPARLASGLFGYTGGLPIPGNAPRPDLDPSLRIRPAPRPSDDGVAAPRAQAFGGTDSHGYEDASEELYEDVEAEASAPVDDTDAMLEVSAEDVAEDYVESDYAETNVNIESPEERE